MQKNKKSNEQQYEQTNNEKQTCKKLTNSMQKIHWEKNEQNIYPGKPNITAKIQPNKSQIFV